MPNNPMPFLVYKGAVDVAGDHPEAHHRKTVRRQWLGRDVAQRRLRLSCTTTRPCTRCSASRAGHARVRFGGERGEVLEISAGDVAILPAGTGHQCISASADFSVVGAYPPGPPMDLVRPNAGSHAKALKTIPQVTLPKTDPVMGADGPLVRSMEARLTLRPIVTQGSLTKGNDSGRNNGATLWTRMATTAGWCTIPACASVLLVEVA